MYLKVKEAAARLGVSAASIYRWAKLGQIPVRRFGGSLRIPEAVLAKADESRTGPLVSSSILTLREAAQYLKVSRTTLYDLVGRGLVPGRRVGSVWRFHVGQLDEFLRGKVARR